MSQSQLTASYNSKFNLLEIGRAIAAILVVFHHTGSIMAEPRFYGVEPLGGRLKNFNVGVDFFFVLSGFIIAWVHRQDIGDSNRIAGFVRKRFMRIFPPYWGVLFPLIALYQLFPSAGRDSQRSNVNIFLSTLLLPNPDHPILGVAWTLTHEMFFYTVFGIIILVGRRLLLVFPVWATAIILWNLGEAAIDHNGEYARAHFPISFLLSAYNLEFLLGLAAAELLHVNRIPIPQLFVLAGTLVFLGFMFLAANIQQHVLFGRLAFSLPAVLFVLGAVEVERYRRLEMPQVVLLIGAASYSIYLVHPVALSFFVHAVFFVTRVGNTKVVVMFGVITSIFAGIFYHIFVERKIIFILKKYRFPLK